MINKSHLFCAIAGLAIASAAPTAQAAKPTEKQIEAKAAKLAVQRGNFKQPRTVAEGEATVTRMANGATGALVPSDLWNQLSVEKDAQGNPRVHEADGTIAAASTSEGLSHE